MCGRYTLEDINALSKFYEVELPTETKPNYNAAPTQTMPIIKDGKEVELMKWGFHPFWMKDKPGGCSINGQLCDQYH